MIYKKYLFNWALILIENLQVAQHGSKFSDCLVGRLSFKNFRTSLPDTKWIHANKVINVSHSHSRFGLKSGDCDENHLTLIEYDHVVRKFQTQQIEFD